MPAVKTGVLPSALPLRRAEGGAPDRDGEQGLEAILGVPADHRRAPVSDRGWPASAEGYGGPAV